MSNDIVEPFERLLAGACTPQAVRDIEACRPADALWNAIESSGFLDALVPEGQGGFGLPLADAFGLVVAAGRHASPVPVGHTMLARAALARAGAKVPRGPIAIAPFAEDDNGRIVARHAPYGLVAQWFILPLAGRWLLLARSRAKCTPGGIHGSLHADLEWPSEAIADFTAREPLAWHDAGAIVAAAQVAGAMERVLDMTLQFANDRVQFGRPLGKFQAIQHQLAVMAENAAAARMAAQIGFDSPNAWPLPLRAATAKARTSEAAALAAPMAHAIHGAIGVTAELDLQLYTRRLHEWRAEFGSERVWNAASGRALLASGRSALDFMRSEILPS